MNTENLNAMNVKVLDQLLRICIKDGRVTRVNLPIFGDKFFGDIPEFKMNYFRDYIEMIKVSGKAKVIIYQEDFLIDPITGVTKEFIDSGGFQAIYDEHQADIANEKLLREKNITDAEISRFTRDKLKPYYRLSIGGFIFGIIAIIISIIGLFLNKG